MSEFFQEYVICNIPEWLSAIGTLLAVIVALYFSRKRSKISCLVESNISKIIEQDESNSIDVISISIVNIGTRAFTIHSIYWQYGMIKKKLFFQPPTLSNYSTELPKNISDGEEVNIYIPIKIFHKLINESRIYFRNYLFIKKYFLKIVVYTSTRKRIIKRVGKSIRSEIKVVLKTA